MNTNRKTGILLRIVGVLFCLTTIPPAIELVANCKPSTGALAQTDRPSSQPTPVPSPQAQPTATPPPANPADVSSMDAIIGALYEVLSGPAESNRDWNRMRSLFAPGARLIPTGPTPSGALGWRVVTLEDYITRIGPSLEKEGLYENEVGRQTESWANIAQVFSAYESRLKSREAKPYQRGINSIELLNDGKRWWIVSVMWQNEDQKNMLPEKFLKR